MSSDGTCIAITHAGARCTSAATDAAGHCAHHARMARVMALAPKSTTANASSPKPRTSIGSAPSPTTTFDFTTVKKDLPSAQPVKQVQSSYAYGGGGVSNSATATTAFTAASPKPTAHSTHSASWLLPNESMLAAANASFVFPALLSLPSLPGSLFVTNFRLRFEPLNAALRSPGHLHRLLDDAIVGIPRACVAKLSYPQSSTVGSRTKYDNTPLPTQLTVKFKDLRMWTLSGDITTLMTTLNRHCFVDSPLSLFAFVPNNARSGLDEQRHLEGHRIYNVEQDFARMGVDLTRSAYRVTDLNRGYAICATYPPQLVVPSSMSDTEIASVAEFRSKGRLPICSFVHPRNSASIWRCAQPKRGIFNAQNAADERYIAHIALSNRNQSKIWIADCRPELNARANNFTGGGTESSSLQHARVSFLNIANIHAMRESLDGVRSLAHTVNTDLDFAWWTRVEETKWLLHVRLVLSAAVRVADSIENKQTTVLVHCSDGWDRTGQLCALSQLLLDRHYRTITGFMQIVEKEWIRPGHKFHDRIGPGKSDHDDQSPIFLQFLDCVWQLWRQYPTYFEFTATFLEQIADAVFSGQYGTFLGNCDRERTAWQLATRTPSLWTDLLQRREQFTNPFFREQSENVLIPPVSSLLRNVTLWSDYYFRGSAIETVPHGNTCPPTWGLVTKPTTHSARTTQQDLADAMAAALLKIQVLEQELIVAKEQQPQQQQSISALQAALYTPQPLSVPPVSVPHETPRPPVPSFPSSTLHPSSRVDAISSTSASPSLSPPPPPPVAPTNTWTCAICSKVNHLQSAKCVVCGRPPPPTAAITQL